MTLVALREGVRNTDIFQASTKLESILTGVILQLFPSPDQQTVALVTLAKFLKSLLYVVMETYRREAADEIEQRNRELASALEYQTATSDVLNVISRSTSDMQPVLDTMVETAARLCGANTGTITIRDGEVYRYVSSSTAAAEPEHWAIIRQRTVIPGRGSIAGRVALEGRVVHVEDIRADPDYALPETVASGRRTQLGVPLLRDSGQSASSCLRGNGSSRLPSGRSSWCAPLPTRRSSRSRMRGCSANCRPARVTSKNRSNTRPQPATCSRSSAARPPMCNRCWTQSTADRRAALRRQFRNGLFTRGRGLPPCVVLRAPKWNPSIGRSGASKLLSASRDSVVAAGGARRQGRACCATSLADPDYASPEAAASGRRTIAWSAAAARGGRSRHDWSLAETSSSRIPSGRSNWCAPLPTRRSSRSRMRGCSLNCRRAPRS